MIVFKFVPGDGQLGLLTGRGKTETTVWDDW